MKFLVGVIALVVWIGAVVLKHVWPDVDVAQIIASAQLTLVGLGVYHLNAPEVPDVKAPPVAPGQGGFARPLLLVALALLAGCAGLNVQWVATASYNSPASTQAVLTPGGPLQAAPVPMVAASGSVK